MRISDWSSDVCSSDLLVRRHHGGEGPRAAGQFQRLPRRQDQRGAARRNPSRQEQRRPGWDWRAADDRRAAGDRQCDRGRDGDSVAANAGRSRRAGGAQTGMIGRILKIAIGAVVLVAAGVFAWLFFAPGPLDFAGGETVALADYKGADPTGVPPSLRNASMVDRKSTRLNSSH